MKILSVQNGERAAILGGFLSLAYLAGSTRGIKYFNGANRKGLFWAAGVSSIAVLGTADFKSSRSLSKRCLVIGLVSVGAPIVTKLLGKGASLGLRSSLKLGMLKVVSLIFVHQAFSPPIYHEKRKDLQPKPFDGENPPKDSGYYYSSEDTFYLRVNIHMEDLLGTPMPHMEALSYLIEKSQKKELAGEGFQVEFLEKEAVDGGGVSREYFDELFKGVLNNKALFRMHEDTQLALPCIDPEVVDPELSFFEHMGRVLMCVHQTPITEYTFDINSYGKTNRNIYIGCHFDNRLFNGIIQLNADEVDTPFERLSNEAKLRVFKGLVAEGDDVEVYKKLIDWFERFEMLTSEEREEAQTYLRALDYTFSKENLLTALLKSEMGGSLAPIHAIARGMKQHLAASWGNANREWDTFVGNNYLEISTKIQGSLDRAALLERFRLHNTLETPHCLDAKIRITKRFDWLKEWIENGATEIELKQYLKCQTGSTSIPPKGVYITVTSQWIHQEPYYYIPWPRFYTCEFLMQLSPIAVGNEEYNDGTKESFIKCLKAVINDPSFTTH